MLRMLLSKTYKLHDGIQPLSSTQRKTNICLGIKFFFHTNTSKSIDIIF